MTVPHLNRLGFTARGRHERCRSVDLSFRRARFAAAPGLFPKRPRCAVFKTAARTALLAFVLFRDRWSCTLTGPRCVTYRTPRHAAGLALSPHGHSAVSSRGEANNPDPNILRGRTSRRQSARSRQARECLQLRHGPPAFVRTCNSTFHRLPL